MNKKINQVVTSPRYTPENVTELGKKEIFVFGSDNLGVYGDDTASIARKKFGAVYGVGEGVCGQTYAITTLWWDKSILKKHTLDEIKNSIYKLYVCAEKNPDYTFLVTKIGSKDFAIEEMAKLFNELEHRRPSNIVLPVEFSSDNVQEND